MAEGFDNENYVSDEMDGTITLLLLGLQRAGKTSIKMVFKLILIFFNKLIKKPYQTASHPTWAPTPPAASFFALTT